MNSFKKFLLTLLFLIATTTAPIFGHAHVFIDYTLHASFTDSTLSGVYVSWTFDRMFTVFIKKEFDKDKNGEFSKEEQEDIFKNSFCNLKKSNFFAVAKLNSKEIPIPMTEKFSAKLIKKNDVVYYSFFIPLNIKIEKHLQIFSLYFFDPVIYVAYTIMQEDIGLIGLSSNTDAKIKLKRKKYINQPTVYFKEK